MNVQSSVASVQEQAESVVQGLLQGLCAIIVEGARLQSSPRLGPFVCSKMEKSVYMASLPIMDS